MRDDILIKNDSGGHDISIYKAIGKGYENGWFENCKARYRFFVGARNTKKSKDILGYEPIMKILSDERRNILICRQNDSDNRQTTFENIVGCIWDLGIENSFKIIKNPLVIEYIPTKQMIIFRGLNNPTSLNSLTFAHGYLTDVYVEEAFEVESYADFRKLDGSLRGKLPPGLSLQITCTMNTWNQDCWIYQEFFKGHLEDDYELLNRDDITHIEYSDPNYVGNYGKGLFLHKSTYKINEFRDKENYDAGMQQMREKAPEIYKVEALGMWGNATEATYPEFNDSCLVSIQEILTKHSIIDFAIGIDTGLSDGSGKRKVVHRGEDVNTRIKSATTMQLIGIASGYDKIICIDEYFHSNDRTYNRVNTDNQDVLTEPQLMKILVKVIVDWVEFYGQGGSKVLVAGSPVIKTNNSNLMQGTINVYVDSADLGFRQGLEVEARRLGIYNINFIGATKISIQSRVDFSRLLMAYGDFLVCREKCPNLIRELKNSRKGEKGEPRKDTDDHAINAKEYAWAPMRNSLVRWKTFKEH